MFERITFILYFLLTVAFIETKNRLDCFVRSRNMINFYK
jgi:hypothetical protein